MPDTALYTAKMNSSDTTAGGYAGSQMFTSNLATAKSTINDAFGANHILSHRQLLTNAVTNGYPSGVSWYDSTVELMTEQNVYGCKVLGVAANGQIVPNNHTIDKSQYPLFALNSYMISNRNTTWLRDVVSATHFAFINSNGLADCFGSANNRGVRPAFSIRL